MRTVYAYISPEGGNAKSRGNGQFISRFPDVYPAETPRCVKSAYRYTRAYLVPRAPAVRSGNPSKPPAPGGDGFRNRGRGRKPRRPASKRNRFARRLPYRPVRDPFRHPADARLSDSSFISALRTRTDDKCRRVPIPPIVDFSCFFFFFRRIIQ